MNGEGRHMSEANTLKDGTRIQVDLKSTDVLFNATGTLDAVAEVGEQLAWLGAALRSSPYSSAVASCTPHIRDLKIEKRSNDQSMASCYIDFNIDSVHVEDVTASDGQCWHALFNNPVLVEGFPIQARPERNTGIEIPLNVMAELAGARRLQTFAGNVFIKSFSCILLLTKRVADIVVWHFLFNDNGEHICYTDPRIRDIAAPWCQNAELHSLQSARHVVGWCSKVSSLAGSPNANYSIDWSQLQKGHQGCAFEKVVISGGQFVTLGASFVVGKKDKPVFIKARDDYLSQLRWISQKFVILYDVDDRRAWMIDGCSALLHLVRASLEHNRDDEFAESFLFDSNQLEEAYPIRVGKAAAISVLTNERNSNIKIHQKRDDSYDEETTTQDGNVDRVTKRKTTFYCFKDRVDHVYHILEQIIAYQAQIESQDGVGFKVRSSSRRQLEGFDFMDIASDQDPLYPRVITLASSGVGWVDFARAMHAVTLFGRGFGDLFTSASDTHPCNQWRDVPKGHDHLAVCVSDLQWILKRRGSTASTPWRLVDNIIWYNPDKIFAPCKGEVATNSCCDRVQVLLPSSTLSLWTRKYISPARLELSGAVIFGHNRKLPLRWGDSGDPEEVEAAKVNDAVSLVSEAHDSGIGSSIASTPSSVAISQVSATSPRVSRVVERGPGTWLFNLAKVRRLKGVAGGKGNGNERK
ncbi:hypothetical protein K505DRAFT_322311 [Melanomma pulvis-pyrius CBS 109.77]|uniref:Uncharacterized protein n=1 Tax=Melanomma pulvis-pyrius CBS 109.77 TaxID=1314802 RepID=A0A6A6XMN0_9PLEO|nr:hypothetical protein K505DRAFT_322311 [Melanomma pulvis-pyrius CBS 109.77]